MYYRIHQNCKYTLLPINIFHQILIIFIIDHGTFPVNIFPWIFRIYPVGAGWGLFSGGGHLQPCERALQFIYGHHRGCLNNPIFSNLELCAACWVYFMWHHELWLTSVSHPFSSLNSSLGFDGGNHYQEITITNFRLVLLPLYSFLSLSFLLTLFRLVCYCSFCLCFSPEN